MDFYMSPARISDVDTSAQPPSKTDRAPAPIPQTHSEPERQSHEAAHIDRGMAKLKEEIVEGTKKTSFREVPWAGRSGGRKCCGKRGDRRPLGRSAV